MQIKVISESSRFENKLVGLIGEVERDLVTSYLVKFPMDNKVVYTEPYKQIIPKSCCEIIEEVEHEGN